MAFALFCFVTAVRFAMETNGLLLLLGSYGHIERSIFQVIITLKVVGLVAFTHLAFEIPAGKVRRIIYAITLGFPIITAIILPFGLLDSRVLFIPIIPLVMMFFSALRSRRLHDNYYNYLYLIVYFIYCIAQPLERFVLSGQFYMPAASHNLLMVLTQFFMLSVSYAQSEKSEQRLVAFLKDIQHEVRSPLQIISTGTDYANHCLDINDEKEARTMQATIQNEAMRLGRMINGMVELATEGGVVNRQKIDFAVMLKTCAQNTRLVLEQKGNSFNVEIAPDLPYVYAEAEALTRVPINLFANAANSTKNGEVTLKATADKSYITVQIIDTGEGISADILPNVFERGISDKGGKGYGLAICKTIIEAHGGTIDIESETGIGTTVTFTIPVYGGQSEVAKRE